MKRAVELDVIRGIAVLLVLFHHITNPAIPEEGAALPPVIRSLQLGGWVGVDIFFVLSGFLVAGLLFREYRQEGSVDILRFLVRRAFKIYPSFYIMVGVSAFLFGVKSRDFLPELAFIQNYHFGFMWHTWSLAVEEHFYLLLALIVLLLARSKKSDPFAPVPWITAGLLVICLAARLFVADRPFNLMIHYFPTHLRIDELSLGASLGYLYHFHQDAFTRFAEKYKIALLPVGILCLLPPFISRLWDSPFLYTCGFTLAALGSGALVTAATVTRLPHWFLIRFTAYVGVYSYSIYLWHSSPAFLHFVQWLPKWTYIPLAVAVGIILGLLIERPFLGIRDVLVPARKGASSKLTLVLSK